MRNFIVATQASNNKKIALNKRQIVVIEPSGDNSIISWVPNPVTNAPVGLEVNESFVLLQKQM